MQQIQGLLKETVKLPPPQGINIHTPGCSHLDQMYINLLNSMFSKTLATKKTRRGLTRHCWDLWSSDIFYLISLLLSFSPLTSFPIPLSLSLSHTHLLLNKIHTFRFGIWSHFHLNSGRNISLIILKIGL